MRRSLRSFFTYGIADKLTGRLADVKIIPTAFLQRRKVVPVVTQLGGIKIELYYNEDHGPPHVHVWCGDDHWTWISIEGLEVLGNKIPVRCYRVVKKWMETRKDELMEAWYKARRGERVGRIF